MRVIMGGLIALVCGPALATVAPREAAAQARVTVPIIVNRPAAGPSGIRVFVQGSPRVAGAAGGPATGGVSVPSHSQALRIVTPDGQGGGLSAGGARETRVFIREVPRSAGQSGASPPVRGFASVPASSQALTIRIEEDPGDGSPATSRELRIFVNGAEVDTPLVLAPE